MATTYEICLAKDDPAQEQWATINDLGITDPERVRLLAATDTLTFTVKAGSALTDDALFAHKALVRFRRVTDGVPELLFLGRVYPEDRGAEGPSESYAVEVRGMWDWFEAAPMRQPWTESAGVVRKPRVILFCDADGNRMTTGAQIAECVIAARAAGCPCAAPAPGDILSGFTPPFDEQVNVSIAVAVCKALANHPHACCWFDYSERAPRFYVRTRQSLPAVTLDVAGKTGIRVKPRKDLQPPALAICFEKEHTVDGQSRRQTVIDYAPLVAGETPEQTQDRLAQADVVWGVFDLQGSSRQTVSQEIVVEELSAAPGAVAWWKSKVPRLADYADADIVLSNPQRSGALSLPAILVKGTIQKWMNVDIEREVFTVDAKLTRRAGGLVVEVRKEKLSVELLMTDAVTKTYKTTTAYDSGESVPVGMAAAMWAEWQQLHYQGRVTVAEEEPALSLAPGKVLNLSGGRPEWAGMAAMISRVTERFQSGETECEFGVPGWIDLDSRFAWYRSCRTRRYAFSRVLRDAGADDGGGGVTDVPGVRDAGDTAEIIRRRFFDPAASVRHEIDLDAQSFSFATSSDGTTTRVIKPREVLVPYLNGTGTPVAKLAQCLCSEGYGVEKTLGGLPSGSVANQVLGTNGSNEVTWLGTVLIG